MFRWIMVVVALTTVWSSNALADDEPVGEESTQVPAQEVADDPDPDGKHCTGEERMKLLLRNQFAVLQINPIGLEYSARVGLCMPFISAPGVLFDFTRFEFGATTYISPSFVEGGGYVEWIPLSFLQLRAEILGLVYFPLFDFDRTGYHSVPEYDVPFNRSDMPSENASTETGWNANFFAILRAKVPLGSTLRLVIVSVFSAEYFNIGPGDFYFNLRREVITRKSDWILANDTLLLFEFTIADDVDLRIGPYNGTRAVPGSGYSAIRTGGMVMAAFGQLGPFHEFSPFVRVAAWTRHAHRQNTVVALMGILGNVDIVSF